MGKKLTTYVHADGKVYKPGDEVPKSVTNPKAWGEDPTLEGGTQTGSESLVSDYESAKVSELKAEIERRNEGRAEEDLLSSEGVKADLVAELEADDAASA